MIWDKARGLVGLVVSNHKNELDKFEPLHPANKNNNVCSWWFAFQGAVPNNASLQDYSSQFLHHHAYEWLAT